MPFLLKEGYDSNALVHHSNFYKAITTHISLPRTQILFLSTLLEQESQEYIRKGKNKSRKMAAGNGTGGRIKPPTLVPLLELRHQTSTRIQKPLTRTSNSRSNNGSSSNPKSYGT
ncbi:unnamed protein product [Lactuca virosa]|uniref:Uncharacterized protein n=1 Tax=Lactuca virosa TaxID=75947 RepID=A0AAU9NCJ8_9ASTR|nr:unnamed protein product [Lactuca virosa]